MLWKYFTYIVKSIQFKTTDFLTPLDVSLFGEEGREPDFIF